MFNRQLFFRPRKLEKDIFQWSDIDWRYPPLAQIDWKSRKVSWLIDIPGLILLYVIYSMAAGVLGPVFGILSVLYWYHGINAAITAVMEDHWVL